MAGETDLALTTWLENVLQKTTWTSANPIKTNTVKNFPGVGFGPDFEEIFKEVINNAIEDYLTLHPPQTKKEAGEIAGKKGLTETKALALVRQGMGVAQDPTNLVQIGLARLPHAALIAFAISLAPIIFEQLTRPGGPFDTRFKRVVDLEINAFLSRQTQKDTEMGFRQVIIQSKKGFTAANGFNAYNTLAGIREGGINDDLINRVGMKEHVRGDYPFE